MNRQELEQRRLAAADYFRAGMSQAQVARILNASRTSACRWHQALQRGESFASRKSTGRPQLLNAEQRAEVARMRQSMTCPQLSEWIMQQYGVRLHPDHLARMYKRSKVASAVA